MKVGINDIATTVTPVLRCICPSGKKGYPKEPSAYLESTNLYHTDLQQIAQVKASSGQIMKEIRLLDSARRNADVFIAVD